MLSRPRCCRRPLSIPSEIQIFAVAAEVVTVRDILAHLREATFPARLMPARDPPLWELPDLGQESGFIR